MCRPVPLWPTPLFFEKLNSILTTHRSVPGTTGRQTCSSRELMLTESVDLSSILIFALLSPFVFEGNGKANISGRNARPTGSASLILFSRNQDCFLV
jgi:hypothetical protein